ncbi:MAG: hypothetical protein IMZ58_04650 [Thermoplasmata archaeon]|nr:hypothetical protein [Thermoplasmata archaeon]
MPKNRNNNQQEPLTKSDWIQYLSHIASYNQNYSLGFGYILFAALAILVAVISFPEIKIQYSSFEISSRFIISIVAIILVGLWWGLPKKINFGKGALSGKSANRLLSYIFSSEHPELKNSKDIQRKWGKIKQKIENTNDKERKELLKERTKKITDTQCFDNWFNDTL